MGYITIDQRDKFTEACNAGFSTQDALEYAGLNGYYSIYNYDYDDGWAFDEAYDNPAEAIKEAKTSERLVKVVDADGKEVFSKQ